MLAVHPTLAQQPFTRATPFTASVRALTRMWTLDLLVSLGLIDTLDEDTWENPRAAMWRLIGALPEHSGRPGAQRKLRGLLTKMARECETASTASPEAAVPATAALADELGLSDIERRILAVLAVRDLDRDFHALLNTIEREEALGGLALIARWSGLSQSEVRRSLSNRNALVGMGLVEDGLGDRSATAYSVNDRLLSLLEAGEASPKGFLSTLAKPALPGALMLEDYPHLADLLPAWLAYLGTALERRAAGVNVLIHGAPGTGKTELCRALAARLGAQLLQLEAEDQDGDPLAERRLLSAVHLTQRALGSKENTLLLVDEADGLLTVSHQLDLLLGRSRRDPGVTHKSWLVDLLETNPMPTLWVANDLDGVHDALLRRFDLVLHLEEPPAIVKRRILETAFDGRCVSAPLLSRLADLRGLQPGHAEALGRVVRTMPPEMPVDGLIERQTRELRKVLGLSPLKRQAVRPLGPFRLDWLNPDRPIEPLLARAIKAGDGRFCMFGPPGTGKSAFAAELAHRLQRPLHAYQGGELLSCFVGETEKAIAAAFARAQTSDAVLLIDEAEGLLSDRRSLRQSWELTTVNALLTALDGHDGYVVLTTNLVERLDPAVLRRMEHKLELRLPTAEQRRSLWARFREHFEWKQGADLDSQLDALDGLTPGDFHQVARQYHGDKSQATPFAVVQALRAELALRSKMAADRCLSG